jgi:hypothetical protein
VKVTGEVEVDLIHGDDLGVATTCSAALYTEHWAQAGLPNAHDHVLAEPPQRLTHADRHRALAFAGGGGIDAGDKDETPLRLAPRDGLGTDLCLVPAVGEDLIGAEPHLGSHLGDGPELRRLGDGDVGRDVAHGYTLK